jgi:hypothetical protein
MVARLYPVVLFPFFSGLTGVKTELLPVQREILFCFVGRETVKGNVGTVVVVVDNGWKYFLQVFPVRNVHAVEIIVLDDLVVRFDQRVRIVHIQEGCFLGDAFFKASSIVTFRYSAFTEPSMSQERIFREKLSTTR